jgi:hypothetical protein
MHNDVMRRPYVSINRLLIYLTTSQLQRLCSDEYMNYEQVINWEGCRGLFKKLR